MSALAHYIEGSGIPTAAIALIRPQAERISPPRALWVPFELGRPLGPPKNAGFQSSVLKALLSLFAQESDVPILRDYTGDAPDVASDALWRFPEFPENSDVALGQQLKTEIEFLSPFFHRATAESGRTTFGVSGLTMEQAEAYILGFLESAWPTSPNARWHAAQALRFAVDDLKAYYLETAASVGGTASSTQLVDWFWDETAAGNVLMALRLNLLENGDDTAVDIAEGAIVPRSRV